MAWQARREQHAIGAARRHDERSVGVAGIVAKTDCACGENRHDPRELDVLLRFTRPRALVLPLGAPHVIEEGPLRESGHEEPIVAHVQAVSEKSLVAAGCERAVSVDQSCFGLGQTTAVHILRPILTPNYSHLQHSLSLITAQLIII